MTYNTYIFQEEVTKLLGLTQAECAILREWECFPIARRVKGTCITAYFTSDVIDFRQSIDAGGVLHDRVQYLLARSLEM